MKLQPGDLRTIIDCALVAVLLALLLILAPEVEALDDNSAVPVLLYHSRAAGPNCDANDTDVLAFERDVRILRSRGYVLQPLLEIVKWRLGLVDGSSLPERVAAISFDDGFDRDWMSGIPSMVRYPGYPCPYQLSVREIAEGYNVPVTFFVIASRVVRQLLSPDYFGDNWWADAAPARFSGSGLMRQLGAGGER